MNCGLRISGGAQGMARPMPRTFRVSLLRRNPRPAVTRRRWAQVRLFAMDVDGVLTDGTVIISSDGTEAKAFSILDGFGLRALARAGVTVAWISGRASGATSRRATELEIPHVVQGRIDKGVALQELALQQAVDAGEIVYMGDDVIDVAAMAWAGIGVAPPDAMAGAIAAADYVTRRTAGQGAVREVCDLILASRQTKGSNEKRPRSKRP
jgi:3-deoxy-D-manno-octulosonate 8-phosphate phosphatase (KDO 8-P phosphatase)